MAEVIKALILAANPANTGPLQLDEEIRAISQKIEASRYRNLIDVVAAWAVRPDDLLQLLNQHSPDIVHFSGHGVGESGIILLDKDGQAKTVSTVALTALFSTVRDTVRLVVLNACYSELQAQAIVAEIDCAIGMRSAVGDPGAIVFAASLYRALAFGKTVGEAYAQGRAALLLEGMPEDIIPVLLARDGVDPHRLNIMTEGHTHRSRVRDPAPAPLAEPVNSIAAALALGAAAEGCPTRTAEVDEAYKELRERVVAQLRHEIPGQSAGAADPDPLAILAAHDVAPSQWEVHLKHALKQAGADTDAAILTAAMAVLQATQSLAANPNKYNVDVRGAQGVQVGDHGHMTVQFGGSGPPGLRSSAS